tara:strand:+ start:53217 stop:53519 length:303 start_codon:yes stop_codon:yes gene_type:complete
MHYRARGRLWLAVAVISAAVTIGFSLTMIFTGRRTQASVEKLILRRAAVAADWRVTHWAVEGGAVLEVSTPSQPNELPSELDMRHTGEVAEMQLIFPPVN